MTKTTLALAVFAALALVLPAVPASAGTVVEDQAALPKNPCKPYPKDPTVYDEAWCTGKGIGNATRIFLDNILDGNYTTLHDYVWGAWTLERTILSCTETGGNSTQCPNVVVGAFRLDP